MPGQDLGREAGGDRPAVGLAELVGELIAVGEGERCSVLGMEQKLVLGQKPGEEQPVPLLVGAFCDQQLLVLAELAPLGA